MKNSSCNILTAIITECHYSIIDTSQLKAIVEKSLHSISILSHIEIVWFFRIDWNQSKFFKYFDD